MLLLNVGYERESINLAFSIFICHGQIYINEPAINPDNVAKVLFLKYFNSHLIILLNSKIPIILPNKKHMIN